MDVAMASLTKVIRIQELLGCPPKGLTTEGGYHHKAAATQALSDHEYSDVFVPLLGEAIDTGTFKDLDLGVKCTAGPRTWLGVSSRSLNFQNAYLDPQTY
jgi:hypothetical protein